MANFRDQDRSDQDIDFLGDQLRTFQTDEVIRADWKMQGVLFQRRNGNDDDVSARRKVLHFGPRHVRQVVLHLLFMPQRIEACACATSGTSRIASNMSAFRVFMKYLDSAYAPLGLPQR